MDTLAASTVEKSLPFAVLDIVRRRDVNEITDLDSAISSRH